MSPQQSIAHYKIVSKLGEGGMGAVYRATDTKLNRDVAIKVLPETFAADPDRLARFTREAQVLASLNHPNIAAIYGVEDRALIMELVEGDELKGPLPVGTALTYARQIAEALEAAHDKGIIHRDLKPANVKVTPQGSIKVLDFGLAAVTQANAVASGNSANSPTLTMMGATQAGLILGTAGYMSPEQAAGKPVDRRADIWSFGVVLHEMLTGKRLFDGETVSHTLASVLQGPIDFDSLPKQTPNAVRNLLKRCLDRDLKTRLRDIGEARIAILNLGKEPEPAPSEAGAPQARLPWIAATAALGVIAAVALWAPWRTSQPDARPLLRLDVDLGEDVSLPSGWASPVAISPDGTRLVYPSGKLAKLFTRRLDQAKATEIPGTEGPQWLGAFFSVDGQWVGFPTPSNKVAKVSVEGGAVVPLTLTVAFTGGSWDEQGNILVGSAYGGLKWLPAGGGTPETLVDGGAFRPQILPGSKAVLFHTYKRGGQSLRDDTIEVLTLADRRRKIIARGASPKFLATSNGSGHLVYLVKSTMFAIGFDPVKLETRGTAAPVLDDVAYYRMSGFGAYDFSAAPAGHGTLVYRRASANDEFRKMAPEWVVPNSGPNGGANEKRAPLEAKPALYVGVSLSPEGKRVAWTILDEESGGYDLWVYDIQRDATTRLTFDGTVRGVCRWSPGGQLLVYGSDRGVFQVRADGASSAQPLTGSQVRQTPSSFTPDAKRLAYTEGEQIWTVPLEDQGGRLKAGKPEQFLKSSSTPRFSPDGRWLAYQSNESGKWEVYVRAFPPPSAGSAGKWQISNRGGNAPHWSSNGHDLLYQSGYQIMASGYTAKGDAFQAEKPRVWISKLGGSIWDLAPDGKRLLVLTPVETEQEQKQEHVVVLLQNFFDYLRQRVPLAK
jgi:serine/threonine-protein kinase